MKLKYMAVTVLAGTLMGTDLSAQVAADKAQAEVRIAGVGGTESPLHREALHDGAIYELRLRVPWDSVELYLSTYARWYLPVDQAVGSGRKLIDVLVREQGDHYNLVFLYWYKDRFKENYYCDYYREFYKHHQKDPEFIALHDEKKANVLGASDVGGTVKTLVGCTANKTPAVASEVVRAIDTRLRSMVDLNEASWNFGVNPCKVWMLSKLDVASPNKKHLLSAPTECKWPLSVETLSQR